MKRKKWGALLLVALMVAGLAQCSKDHDKNKTPAPTKSRRSVLVYMAAQNSLGAARAAYVDSVEIAMGCVRMTGSSDNVFLFMDDDRLPRLYRFYKASNGKAYVQKIKQYDTDLDSTDPATLTAVLQEVQTLFPSTSYGLVMWSHGTGWLPNLGATTLEKSPVGPQAWGVDVGPGGDMAEDETAEGELGKQMEITEMAQALEESGVRPSFVLFDACLMQTIEVAYTLRHVTDYVVGSPAVTSAYGAYYCDQIAEAFFADDDAEATARRVADTYYKDVMENEDTRKYYGDQGCVVSAVKTSELEALAAATAQAWMAVTEEDGVVDMGALRGYCDYEGTVYPDFFDMGVAMAHLLPEAVYAQWRAEAERCVVYRRGSDTYSYYLSGSDYELVTLDREHYLGVSMFVPQAKYLPIGPIDWNRLAMDQAWCQRVWGK